jgi:hypothetical protein
MGNFFQYGVPATGPPPVVCTGTDIYAFIVEAEKRLLRTLCFNAFDRVSDTGKGGSVVHCEPTDDLIWLQFSQTDWVGNKKSVAGIGETEVLIHVPVTWTVGGQTHGGFFTPYIWVNNSFAMVGGRELYGYPKAFGRFDVQGKLGRDPDTFILNTLSGGKKKYLSMEPLIVVSKGPSINPGNNIFTAIMDRYQQRSRRTASDELPFMSNDFVQIVGRYLTTGIKYELFLKQFRDATDENGQRACFQQIACATYTPTKRRRTQAPVFSAVNYGYSLMLNDYRTAPIADDLGVKSQPLPDGSTVSKLSRLELSATTVYWQAPVKSIP